VNVGRAVKVVVAAGLAVTGLAVGGGVSGVATRPATAATIHDAVVSSEGAASMSSDFTVEADGGGKSVTFTGHGVFGGRVGRLVMDLGADGTLEERVTGDGIYLYLSGVAGAAALPGGKHWLFVSYEAMANETGVNLQSLLDQASQNDPRRALENLETTAGPVTDLGPDPVNGNPATHYRVSIDYRKLAQEKLRDSTPDARAQMAALGTKTADVWIDGSDRVVKWSQDLDVGESGQTVHETVTFVITGFDVPLHVEAPSADDVLDIGAAGLAHNTV
jgi:hypothetical protein